MTLRQNGRQRQIDPAEAARVLLGLCACGCGEALPEDRSGRTVYPSECPGCGAPAGERCSGRAWDLPEECRARPSRRVADGAWYYRGEDGQSNACKSRAYRARRKSGQVISRKERQRRRDLDALARLRAEVEEQERQVRSALQSRIWRVQQYNEAAAKLDQQQIGYFTLQYDEAVKLRILIWPPPEEADEDGPLPGQLDLWRAMVAEHDAQAAQEEPQAAEEAQEEPQAAEEAQEEPQAAEEAQEEPQAAPEYTAEILSGLSDRTLYYLARRQLGAHGVRGRAPEEGEELPEGERDRLVELLTVPGPDFSPRDSEAPASGSDGGPVQLCLIGACPRPEPCADPCSSDGVDLVLRWRAGHFDHLLGTVTDRELAQTVGISTAAARKRRQRAGISIPPEVAAARRAKVGGWVTE